MRWLEAALRRERFVLAMGLFAVSALAAIYVWRGAGMGMPDLGHYDGAMFPHRLPNILGEMDWSWGLVVAMWWVMMVAMMTPAAGPLILLHRRVLGGDASPLQAGVASALLLAGSLWRGWPSL